METYFCRLNPPRPTFAADMTPAEAELMKAHADYWRRNMEAGKVVAFGPVADPAGAFGICILEVADEAEADRLTASDPVIRADAGFSFEMHPMPRGAIHP